MLLLGIVPRITYWDAMMLSESIAISLTLLLIAALVWIDQLPAVAVVLIFMLWLFTRDGHLYLGLLLLTGLAWWGWRNQRVAVPIGVAVIMGWGFFAAANNSVIEGYNVSANVAYRIAPNQGQWSWFFNQGMPESDAFATTQPLERHKELTDDPTFWHWSTTVGPHTYLRFLVEHPRFTFGAYRMSSLVEASLVSRSWITPGAHARDARPELRVASERLALHVRPCMGGRPDSLSSLVDTPTR